MGAGLPYCSVCRLRLQPKVNVVFSADGRVRHAECPTVLCAVCSREVLPSTPIRRDGDTLIHGNCSLRRERHADGVSAPSDGDRAARVRARLAAGALPLAEPTKVLGDASNGSVCQGCTDEIPAGQIEYELESSLMQ